jgi:hypothetical protein
MWGEDAGGPALPGADGTAGADASLADRESGNHDKDPKERGTGQRRAGRAGAVRGEGAAALRGRAAELAAARAEPAALAPWRATIARARLARRQALAARRAGGIAKHDKDPMERPPGVCLLGRAARIAAAQVGGAGTAPGVVLAKQAGGPGDGRTLGSGAARRGSDPESSKSCKDPMRRGPVPGWDLEGLVRPARPSPSTLRVSPPGSIAPPGQDAPPGQAP